MKDFRGCWYCFFLMLIFFIPTGLSFSQNFVLPYLLLDPSARAHGMAGAFTAISNDMSAIHYNPAGLSRLKLGAVEYNKFLVSEKSYDDFTYHFGGYAYNFSEVGTVAIGIKYFSYGRFIITNEFSPEPSGSFEPYDFTINLSYGTEILKNFSYGFSVKYNHSSLSPFGAGSEKDDVTAKLLSLDIGFLYENILSSFCYIDPNDKKFPDFWNAALFDKHRIPPGISVGLSILNLGPKVVYIDSRDGDYLPQTLKLGIAWNFVDTRNLGILAAFDVEKSLVPSLKNYKDPSYKTIFTTWTDEPFNDELKQMIRRFGLEIVTPYLSFRLGRLVDDIYPMKYWTYGISVGTETARLNFSICDFNEYDYHYSYYFLDDKTKVLSLSFAY
jgi:hypothetical protein